MAERRLTPTPEPPERREKTGFPIAAACVHVFTASGIICALLATLATLDGRWSVAFAWLGLALLIDGVDGTFARLVHVQSRLPRFSGERLDMVIDYVTYVFVPVLMLIRSNIVSGWVGIVLGSLILLSSLYHFSDTESKTEDHHFVGFPAIWNLVAFYLFAFPMPEWLVLVIVIACAALTFVPMRWLHPMRVRRLMWLNVGATLAWSAAAAWVVLVGGLPVTGPAAWVLLGTLAYAVLLAVTLPLADPAREKKP